MTDYHDEWRKSGLIRPAKEHEHQSGWHEDYDLSWQHGNTALPAAKTKRKAPPKPNKPPCKNCPDRMSHKCGLCYDCYDAMIRARQAAYRAKKRGGAPTKPKPKAIRTECKVCGQPVVKDKTLCRVHYREYQQTQIAKRKETDAEKEESMERRKVLLAELWQKKQSS